MNEKLNIALIIQDEKSKSGVKLVEEWERLGHNVTVLDYNTNPNKLEVITEGDRKIIKYDGVSINPAKFDGVMLKTWGKRVNYAIGIQEIFEQAEVVPANKAEDIKIANNKIQALERYKKFLVPVPEYVTLSRDEISESSVKKALNKFKGKEVIIKAQHGTGGKNIHFPQSTEEATDIALLYRRAGTYNKSGEGLIIQEYIETEKEEGVASYIRAFVINQKLISAMKFTTKDKETDYDAENIYNEEIVKLTREQEQMAINASAAAAKDHVTSIGIRVCGVDMIQGIDGKSYVLEANDGPTIIDFHYHGINMAREVAVDFVDQVAKEKAKKEADEIYSELRKSYGNELSPNIEIIYTENKALMDTGIGKPQNAIDIHRIISKTYGAENVKLTKISTMKDLEDVVKRKADLVFSTMRFMYFENGRVDENTEIPRSPENKLVVNEYLENNGINILGSPASVMDSEIYKDEAKKIFLQAGVPTAAFSKSYIFDKSESEEAAINDLVNNHPVFADIATKALDGATKISKAEVNKILEKNPLFVKPNSEGNSLGVDDNSIIRNIDGYVKKIEEIHKLNQPALVEDYIEGREFVVAVLGNSKTGMESYAAELTPRGNHITLDRVVKDDDLEITSKILDKVIRKKAIDVAEAAFKAWGGRDMAAIDIRFDKNKRQFFVLEPNAFPGLPSDAPHGYLTKTSRRDGGLNYPDIINKIFESALARSENPAIEKPQEIIAR